jgi:hypothetical protein
VLSGINIVISVPSNVGSYPGYYGHVELGVVTMKHENVRANYGDSHIISSILFPFCAVFIRSVILIVNYF